MITKHYKSDFSVPIKLVKSSSGAVYPFRFVFKTQNNANYVASYDGTTGVNLLSLPTSDDSEVYVKLDKHGLRMGELMVEATFYVDAEGWKNDIMIKTFYGSTGVMLVDKKIDDDGTEIVAPVEFDVNFIKGDAFTYDDFTDEQIEALKAPCYDAANDAISAADGANLQATNAETAANLATEKASLADTAANNANEATDNVNTAINNANTAATNAQNVADETETLKNELIGYADDFNALQDKANANTTSINNHKDTTENAHPISAITGLADALELKASTAYVDDAINNQLWYGFEYDKNVSDPAVTRIGNLDLHRSLPIQSAMKGCLIDNTTGALIKYLPKSDWTSETLDGSAGQVMVEISKFYFKHEIDGDVERYKFSTVPLGGFIEIPKLYIGAVEGSVNRVDNTLCSVVNASADYRGGNNNSDWDGTYRSLLGRPATSISRTNFTAYARNRGTTEWNQYLYLAHKVLYWMFILEYGTRNSQAAYTAELDSNGYRQGGLGVGVSTVNATIWNEKFAYNPFVPCGTSNSLGNRSGEVDYTTLDENGDELWTIKTNRYRGIELPFGHIWKWAEGINVDIKTDLDGGTSSVYVCNNPSKFSDTSNVDYELRGLEARDSGYIKKIIGGTKGDIIPAEIGGGSTTFFCDYHSTSVTSSSLRGVLFGGAATNGSSAGFAFSSSSYSPSLTTAIIGSRLCFLPKNN